MANAAVVLSLFLVKQAPPKANRFLDLGCVQSVFHRHFVEALWRFHERLGTAKTRDQIAQEYYHRPDKGVNILAPVDEQCQWLRDIGFQHVDCYFKVFEIALFGGIKPPMAATGT